jgi:hypothetical protein
MKIYWLNNWMIVNLKGRYVQLQGLQPSLPEFSIIEVMMVSAIDSTISQPQLPPQVQELLDYYAELFMEPTELPPVGLVTIVSYWCKGLNMLTLGLTDSHLR